MQQCDIETWVEAAADPSVQEFRQAVHTTLVAISSSPLLSDNMIIKGGILLALRYEGPRFTKDIDFSTRKRLQGFDKDQLLEELKNSLAITVEQLPYDLDCRVQSHELKPPREDATFPTLKIRVGYAYKGDRKHQRLLQGQGTDVVEVDYSFNEENLAVDALEILDGGTILAYSLPDLVGEKYRAIIQQKTRNRSRRQDAYDIYWLIRQGYVSLDAHGTDVLRSLLMKSESRHITPEVHSLRDPEIVERSKAEYETLADEVEEPLPPFEEVFGVARDFYETLPW